MRRRKTQQLKKSRRWTNQQPSRSLRFQHLESRRLLAGDLLADITGLWVTVGGREYYSSDLASVQVDMHVGETLQVTGIDYGLNESYTPEDGVIAFESYVRREHGASEIGSYDYTDGRFGDPVAQQPAAGQAVSHPGLESGWDLGLVDNRIAVVAIRYFGNESAIEDRMFIDVNVTEPEQATQWTEAIVPIQGDWQITDDEVSGDSSDGNKNIAGLTVIETDSAGSQRYEVGVKAKTVEENAYANGFVVVDYRGENDFVYAGLRSVADKWVIGHFDGKFNDVASLKQDVQPRQVYDLRVAVDGSHIALAVDGIFRVSHDFDRTLDQGAVGLANQYAYTHFTGFNFFDNSPEPVDETGQVVSNADGTVITFGDPTHSEADTSDSALADAKQAYESAQEASDQAHLASQDAASAANEAEQRRDEAASLAQALKSAAEKAELAAANASAAHADTLQQIEETENQIGRSADAMDSARADHEAASQDLQVATKTASKVERTADQLASKSEKAEQEVKELQKKIAVLQDSADDAAKHSETLAVAATVARKAADVAQQLAEEAEGAPKSIRKAAEKAAQEADKAADKAEKVAETAAKELKQAWQDIDETREDLEDASQDAESASQDAKKANEQLQAARESLDRASAALDTAERTIEESEAARDAAIERLDGLRDSAPQLAEAAAVALSHAKLAAQESDTARVAAEQAASEASRALAEAHQRALDVEAAQQRLATAELALQQEIAAQQQATDEPPVVIVTEPANPDGDLPSDDFHVYSLNFNHQDDGAFQTVSGTSERVAGQLHLGPTKELLAISVLDEAALPERTATRMYATVRADQLPGLYQNGFIIFDYQSPEDFKYAGAFAGADRWAIGEVVDGKLVDLATLDEVIGQGPAYELQTWIQGDTVTLLVEGQQKVQHTFSAPVDDGRLGLASYNARSRFDQVAVMQLHAGSGDVGIEEVVSDSTIDPAANDPAANDAAISELF